jgi:cytochrome c-type biogenesis protein CcmH
MKKFFVILAFLPCFAFALTAEPRLTDEAAEHRAHTIFQQIRCVVCAGESINDSKADIAKSLRVLVREQITAGQSDAQIISYITELYGDSILMQPPFNPATYLLWLGPVLMLLVGGGVMVAFFRRKPSNSIIASLKNYNQDITFERARVQAWDEVANDHKEKK